MAGDPARGLGDEADAPDKLSLKFRGLFKSGGGELENDAGDPALALGVDNDIGVLGGSGDSNITSVDDDVKLFSFISTVVSRSSSSSLGGGGEASGDESSLKWGRGDGQEFNSYDAREGS